MAGLIVAAVALLGFLGGLELTLLLPIGIVLAIVALLGDVAASRDDVDATGPAGSIASFIQALGVVIAVAAVWFYVDNPVGWAMENWWLLPMGVILLFAYWYAQNRRQVASAETAINRTRRTARRSISDWTSLLVGIFVLTLTAGFAVLQGFGDALAPYGGELAYLITVGLGYVGFGGEAGGVESYIPALSPIQWVGITLFLGGVGLFIQSQA